MLSLLLALAPAAWAWPADGQWVPLEAGGAALEDVAGDHLTGDASLDLFGDPALPAALWYADEAELYLRLRLAGDPQDGSLLRAQTWGWLVELDGDDAFELMLVSEGATGDLTLYSSDGTPGVQPGFLAYTFEGTYGSLAGGEVRRMLGTGGTFFLDVRISRFDLDLHGVGPDALLHLATVAGPSQYLDWSDVGRCNGACGSLLDAVADPVQIDADADGWADPQEAERGTDPLDADSDDDGLLDGEEEAGDADGDSIPDALDCDADGDGILDGTEAGLITADLHPDTDPYAGCFVADADPTAPPTDPFSQDTDGGGLHDGMEDWDFDGELDPAWETDPNDPLDDADADGDGIADVLELQGADGSVNDVDSDGDGLSDAAEWLYDPDGDGVPNFLDDDSDGDDILDASEGDIDFDGDGLPNFLDDDSDGDGIPDLVEGEGDSDEDFLPDYLDPDADGDGVFDDVEGAGDTDGDGIPDYLDDDSDGDTIPDAVEGAEDTDDDGVPDFQDTDADGDTIPDAVEGTDDLDDDDIPNFQDTDSDGDGDADGDELYGDEDCDGVEDWLDPDHEDSFCDTGQPIPGVDTGLDPFDPVNPLSTGGQFTGGSCSTVPGGAGALWLPSLLAGLLIRRRRRAVAAAALLASGPALAQDVNAQRLAPSVDGGPFVKLEDATANPALSGGLGVWVGYADDPLVYRPVEGDEIKVLESVATTNLTGFYSLGLLRVGVDVPLHLYTAGLGIDQPVQLGDARLSGKGTLLHLDAADGLDLGVLLDVTLPTGSTRAFVGSGAVAARGAVLGTLTAGRLIASAELGTRSGTGAEVGDLTVSPALTWGLGGGVALTDTLSTTLEVDGDQWLGNSGLAGSRPAEWLGAAHLRTASGRFTLGAGSGLSRGIGAPDFRVLAGFTLQGREEPEPTPIAVVAPPADEPETGWLVVRAISPGGDPIHGAEIRVLGTVGTAFKTGRDGILEARIDAGNHEVSVAAPGWMAETRTVSLGSDETLDLTVLLRPAEEVVVDTEARRIFLQRKVFFEVDRAELKVESLVVLDRLVEVLEQHPEIARLRVEGHTDVTGSDAHNLELSQQRAQAVVDYLVRSGINAERLEAKGLGETDPLQQGDSDDVHATNRRVEFHILELTR